MPDQASSLNTMDFMSMPGPMRRLLRMMLKKPVATYKELCEMTDAMPEDRRITREELDKTLVDLIEKGWLVKDEGKEAANPTYKIHLGAKEGSDQSRDVTRSTDDTRTRKREGPRMKDLWNAVDTTSDTDYRKRHKQGEQGKKQK